MRLINVKTFELHEFAGDEIPEYVILSHTWGNDEVSFQDMMGFGARSKVGFAKIQGCCAQAVRDGFEYAWIDTCCIDKRSSAELSEAINSMYQWYKDAQICYAYLADVLYSEDQRALESALRKSRWFQRGWTLQELIAPSIVEFYTDNWSEIGTKSNLRKLISEITTISINVLRGTDPKTYSIAQRMSWASKRSTTRVEDQAYCLLGLFEVNMPLLYGEREGAFIRLQEEIMKVSEDYTLFAWAEPIDSPRQLYRGLLATSPIEFANSGEVRQISSSNPETVHSSTARGLQITLPLKEQADGSSLACILALAWPHEVFMCVYLRPLPFGSKLFGRVSSEKLFYVSTRELEEFKRTTIYISLKPRVELTSTRAHNKQPGYQFSLSISPDSQESIFGGSVCPLNTWSQRDQSFFPDNWSTLAIGTKMFMDQTGDRFAVAFGLLGGQPWCTLKTHLIMTDTQDKILGQLYASYDRVARVKDHADRDTKPLRSGSLVTAAVRKRPSEGTTIRYDVSVSFRPRHVGSIGSD